MLPPRAGEEAVGTDVLRPLVIGLAVALILILVFLTLVCIRLRRRLDKMAPKVAPVVGPEVLAPVFKGGTKLYHQTDKKTADIIMKTQQMKPGSGGLAGGGIYFATTPELTAHKAHKKGVILEATVALGRIHTLEAAGDPTMTLQKLNSLGYNSVCIARAVSSGQEYVVYDPKQVSAIRVAPSHAPVQAVWSV